jgi:hypothetical protein
MHARTLAHASVLSLGPDPELGVAPEGGGDGPASEPELPGDRRGAAFARSYLLTPQPNDGIGHWPFRNRSSCPIDLRS